LFFLLSLTGGSVLAAESLLEPVGAQSTATLPVHVTRGQEVRINRRALNAPVMDIDLFGETVTALRDRIDRGRGQTIWTGHLQGNALDTVIVTVRGPSVSGVIYRAGETFRLSLTRDGAVQLLEIDVSALPDDDADALPDGFGEAQAGGGTTMADTGTVQDLLVVYNQAACNSQGSCAGLEADITTAVAELNAAYAASSVDITMNLVGMALTSYTGTGASAALSDLRGTSDGQMDEIHTLRDQLGADVVSFIYDGEGCGIGYLGSSASYAFNVTDEPCLVGNRTMAHEIGHNQGARHDRQTDSTGDTSTGDNFGYRRCSDGSVDDFGSPYFRTIMTYSCSSASRQGIFSNPNRTYLGVPQGVDTTPDPLKAAHNARTLNESAGYVAGFRAATVVEPPMAPSGLATTPMSHDAIDLAWVDNASNESAFEVQRSADGLSWSTIATVSANVTSFGDNGLQPDTGYHYRVRSQNSAGNSVWSNPVMETTLGLPASIDDFAQSDLPNKGSVAGTYSATVNADGNVQTITESHSGGPRNRRKQSYIHGWTFDVTGGAGGAVVTVEAWVSGSEGANFYYSIDNGASWSMMFSVTATSAGTPQSFALPGGVAGPVRIEVRDATQSNGEAVDSVMVDHLMITSYTDPGSPPNAPSGMSILDVGSGMVSMHFTDNSEDEHGFELRRATSDPAGSCTAGQVVSTLGASQGTGTVVMNDGSVSPSTGYWYWASAFNGAGDNGSCSNAAFAQTLAAPQITMTASGYKVKGRQAVDLTWSGASGAQVDVHRGSTIFTTANDGAYTDSIGAKGGGSYTYQVCEAGTSVCSQAQVVTF
jgi:hypothetical protein